MKSARLEYRIRLALRTFADTREAQRTATIESAMHALYTINDILAIETANGSALEDHGECGEG